LKIQFIQILNFIQYAQVQHDIEIIKTLVLLKYQISQTKVINYPDGGDMMSENF
jgi:hypothetical protein